MDVVFGEDASKVRLENGPANMAIVKRFVLNVLNIRPFLITKYSNMMMCICFLRPL
jgi:hypothetical protein